MLHALRSLVLLVPVLLQLWCTAVRAEGSADVHVVLAFDVSGSMFTNAIPNHAAIQAAALNNFFQNYGSTCVRVQIDFMPWGDNADVVTGATIASADGARALWLKIGLSAVTSRGGTNHAKAFKVALARFVNPHTNNILVFSTDEAGSTIHSAGNQLSDLVPKNVSVYAISLGNTGVGEYIMKEILPENGHHFHAKNSTEFEAALKSVLDQVTQQFCLF